MTFKKIFILGATLAVGQAIIKVFFLTALNLNSPIIFYGMYAVIALLSIALARRVGIIMYIEAAFLAVVWFVMSLLADYLITRPLVDPSVFQHLYFWMTYLVMIVFIIVSHKKRHVEIRKEIKSGHHKPTH